MKKQLKIFTIGNESTFTAYNADKTQFDVRPWGIEFVAEGTNAKMYIPWQQIRFIEEVNV